jgi:hypothetical protein
LLSLPTPYRESFFVDFQNRVAESATQFSLDDSFPTQPRRSNMMYRILGVSLAAVTMALFITQAVVMAAEKTHEGKVVKAADGKLTMTDKNGENKHTHDVAANAKISCDGKNCKLEDLKEGTYVRVTTDEDTKRATRIDARTDKK